MTINNIEVVAFLCRACLEEKPIVSQSSDPRFCNDCFEYLSKEAEDGRGGWWVPRQSDEPIKERERKDKSINVTIRRLEKRANSKKNKVVANDIDSRKGSPAVEESVAKLPTKGREPKGVMQHAGGRPRKVGAVHRITKWRRKKAIQGVLL